jgi:aconitate hydratase
VTVVARSGSGSDSASDSGSGGREFKAVVRIDTPGEAEYFRHGGIMQYVLRTLLARN